MRSQTSCQYPLLYPLLVPRTYPRSGLGVDPIIRISLCSPTKTVIHKRKKLAAKTADEPPNDFSPIDVITPTVFWPDMAHVRYFIDLH